MCEFKTELVSGTSLWKLVQVSGRQVLRSEEFRALNPEVCIRYAALQCSFHREPWRVTINRDGKSEVINSETWPDVSSAFQ